LPGSDFVYGSEDASDTRVIKTLLSITNHEPPDPNVRLPLLVTEIFDPAKIEMVRKSYRGDFEVLASDVFVARCLAQNVRHAGLSRIFREILSHGEGSEIYVRTPEQVEGFEFGTLNEAYPKAVLLGVVRPRDSGFEPFLNPPRDFLLQPGDRLVFLAQNYEDCDSPKNFPVQGRDQKTVRVLAAPVKPHWTLLVLGWNHKAADLMEELDCYSHERFEVDVLSLSPIADRQADLKRKGVKLNRVEIRHVEGDLASLSDVKAMNPARYDKVIILGSDKQDTEEESDARTTIGHLILTECLAGSTRTGVVVELMDTNNLPLFAARSGEVLVTPLMASHVLAQVALRRELNSVYEELFSSGGAEIFFRDVADYDLLGREITFGTLKEMAFVRGEIVLGVRSHRQDSTGDWIQLNPPWDMAWIFSEEDQLVVLATYGLADYHETTRE
ncbi:MAG: hypothetical protein O3B73_14440, partial [bacterium]|nr:hypothetical protein [bacterium]